GKDVEKASLGLQDVANLNGNGQDNKGAFFTIGETHVFSATVVNTVSLGVNRTFVHRTGPFAYDVSDLGINAYTYLPKTFYLTGMSGSGTAAGVSGQSGVGTQATNSTNVFSITDNISLIRGRHQLSFGGSVSTLEIISYA